MEIGGGFRVPDVMKQSGARLLEIGATNRVHLSDYRSCAGRKTGPDPARPPHQFPHPRLYQRAGPGRDRRAWPTGGIPLVDDLGSGSLLDTARFGLGHEPTVQESLAAGADLVCFSGDKLLGGPQAGIIVGRADLVAKLKETPAGACHARR